MIINWSPLIRKGQRCVKWKLGDGETEGRNDERFDCGSVVEKHSEVSENLGREVRRNEHSQLTERPYSTSLSILATSVTKCLTSNILVAVG